MSSEPIISVGLLSVVKELDIVLNDWFTSTVGENYPPGQYRAVLTANDDAQQLVLEDASGAAIETGQEIALVPTDFQSSIFTLRGVTIGKEFHWQRQETQSFRGTLRIRIEENQPPPRLLAINDIPLESYLVSVISSEMSATSPMEFLKAHAVISRSWLLAQISRNRDAGCGMQDAGLRPASRILHPASGYNAPLGKTNDLDGTAIRITRWTDRESHSDFDVCADDHCQRYQGITKAHSQTAYDAVTETRGQVLRFDDQIADARFSKCCGGIIEDYRSAWHDDDVPYLRGGKFDGEACPPDASLPLSIEANAARWITSRPAAFCNTTDKPLLEKILPDFDLETTNFFRWETTLDQEEIQRLLKVKLGLDLGPIRGLEPMERGASSRIVRLRITGETGSVIIGKELEIRRALSSSHLYSSAFIVRPEGGHVPDRFHLIGAGWGHGVGLCQIGAAVMAANGSQYPEILAHYFPGCELKIVYE
jgi:SpoIID/LytB domain protein